MEQALHKLFACLGLGTLLLEMASVTQNHHRWKTVTVELDESGIAWVVLNRPEKRNAMSPTLNIEMRTVLEELELEPKAKVVVLTGAGESWSAGMDLK